ncbi:MAG TPA: 50S ribosomal protein L3 [Candidatus Absconditabacterales bacterium]|nr:50S ribosomal protein L3 [Candidatus Absconditabacterales bacterium]HOQ79079.1 50S ribosomal protein L3 [Candidatus Absconditabacterales bacterium]HPK27622.1 50S ribosomal protein L3 [Candidatus Absconditabacterales bacterium]
MNRAGLIVSKKEMTRVWKNGKMIPVTILKVLPQELLRYKTVEKDGYSAAIVGVNKKETNKEKGQKVKYSITVEFNNIDDNFLETYKSGSILDINLLEGVKEVNLVGTSKGKGFQGAMKRFHLRGGPKTRGSKFHRQVGALGNRKPRRVQKGRPHAGHMGYEKVTIKSVEIIDRIIENNEQLLILKGSVPGSYNSFIQIFA